MTETTKDIEARVEEYVPDAMHDDFEDGFASYDATRILILAPIELRGKELSVFHDTPVAAGALWRRRGARLRARVLSESLDDDATVFEGAFSNVREVTDE